VRVVNNTGTAQPVRFDIQGCTPGTAHATTLVHDNLTGFNTLSQPERIKPVTSEGSAKSHVFPPYSFTVIELSLSLANLGVEKSKPVL
jgi:alpha-L-arabinofuranosidase